MYDRPELSSLLPWPGMGEGIYKARRLGGFPCCRALYQYFDSARFFTGRGLCFWMSDPLVSMIDHPEGQDKKTLENPDVFSDYSFCFRDSP